MDKLSLFLSSILYLCFGIYSKQSVISAKILMTFCQVPTAQNGIEVLLAYGEKLSIIGLLLVIVWYAKKVIKELFEDFKKTLIQEIEILKTTNETLTKTNRLLQQDNKRLQAKLRKAKSLHGNKQRENT